jgi:hypothetical protein
MTIACSRRRPGLRTAPPPPRRSTPRSTSSVGGSWTRGRAAWPGRHGPRPIPPPVPDHEPVPAAASRQRPAVAPGRGTAGFPGPGPGGRHPPAGDTPLSPAPALASTPTAVPAPVTIGGHLRPDRAGRYARTCPPSTERCDRRAAPSCPRPSGSSGPSSDRPLWVVGTPSLRRPQQRSLPLRPGRSTSRLFNPTRPPGTKWPRARGLVNSHDPASVPGNLPQSDQFATLRARTIRWP